MYKKILKPILDFLVAFSCLIIFSPIFIIVLISLTYVNKGKPFFFQKRPGKYEKPFYIIKFKTMTDAKNEKGLLLPDADRLTTVGKLVRKTSLDEIPQLINVLKGDMSLVGPRPLLVEYLDVYDSEQRKRHNVKPGITGLAQVKGRNLMKFSERLINDIYYVNNQSLFLDLKILLMTINVLLFRSKTIVNGQTVDSVDDIGLSRNLSSNHFKKEK